VGSPDGTAAAYGEMPFTVAAGAAGGITVTYKAEVAHTALVQLKETLNGVTTTYTGSREGRVPITATNADFVFAGPNMLVMPKADETIFQDGRTYTVELGADAVVDAYGRGCRSTAGDASNGVLAGGFQYRSPHGFVADLDQSTGDPQLLLAEPRAGEIVLYFSEAVTTAAMWHTARGEVVGYCANPTNFARCGVVTVNDCGPDGDCATLRVPTPALATVDASLNGVVRVTPTSRAFDSTRVYQVVIDAAAFYAGPAATPKTNAASRVLVVLSDPAPLGPVLDPRATMPQRLAAGSGLTAKGNVARGENFILGFNEAVQAGAGVFRVMQTAVVAGETTDTFAGFVDAQDAFIDGSIVVFDVSGMQAYGSVALPNALLTEAAEYYFTASAGSLRSVATGLPTPTITSQSKVVVKVSQVGVAEDTRAPTVAAIRTTVPLTGAGSGLFQVMWSEKVSLVDGILDHCFTDCGPDNICGNADDIVLTQLVSAGDLSVGDGSTRAKPYGLMTLTPSSELRLSLREDRKYWWRLGAAVQDGAATPKANAEVDLYFFTGGAATGGVARYRSVANRRCSGSMVGTYPRAVQVTELGPAREDLCWNKCHQGCVGSRCMCDGFDAETTPASPVLCVTPQQCKDLCEASSVCNGFDVSNNGTKCILTREDVCDVTDTAAFEIYQPDWDHFQAQIGRACAEPTDFADKAGQLYVTDRVHVGVDYALEPGMDASLEVTAASGKDLTYSVDSLAPELVLAECTPRAVVKLLPPIVLAFNEDIHVTGHGSVKVKDTQLLGPRGGVVPADVTVNSIRVVSGRFLYVFLDSIPTGAQMYVEVVAGTVVDAAGNTNAGISTKGVFTVTQSNSATSALPTVVHLEAHPTRIELFLSTAVTSESSVDVHDCGASGRCAEGADAGVLPAQAEYRVENGGLSVLLPLLNHTMLYSDRTYRLIVGAGDFENLDGTDGEAQSLEFSVMSDQQVVRADEAQASRDRVMVIPCTESCGAGVPAEGLTKCGAAVSRAVTAVAAGATTVVTASRHGFVIGDMVVLTGVTATPVPNHLLATTGHQVVSASVNSFTLSLSSTGLSVTVSGTAAAMLADHCSREQHWHDLQPLSWQRDQAHTDAQNSAAAIVAVPTHEERANFTSTAGYFCPTNMDVSTDDRTAAHQCYAKCVAKTCEGSECWCDGAIGGYDTPASNALCLSEPACAQVCSDLAGCTSFDMHTSKNRCFLNMGTCANTRDLLADSQYSHHRKSVFIPRIEPIVYTPVSYPAAELGYSSSSMLRFAPVHFAGAGRYKLCFCDSELQARLAGLAASQSVCSDTSQYNIQVGTIHVSGVSCLLKDVPMMRRGECVGMAHGGLRCYAAGAAVPAPQPVYVPGVAPVIS